MKNFMVIDANSIGYTGHQSVALNTGDRSTQAIFHFLKTLRNLRSRFPKFQPIVCWDNDAKWRYELCPDYKGNREPNEKVKQAREDYRAQRPTIKKCLKLLGVPQVDVKGFEADDIAAMIALRTAKTEDAFALLISGDQDWIQLVTENVTWLDPLTEKKVTLKTFEEATGYPDPISFVQAKALKGDTSDNIKGVGGLGEVASSLILKHFGSVSEMIREKIRLGRDFTKEDLPKEMSRYVKPINRFINDRSRIEHFKTNYLLMNLLDTKEPEGGIGRHISRSKLNRDKLLEELEELAFFPIIKDFDGFVSDITKVRR